MVRDMAYELVKSIRKLIQQGVGDTARLEYILEMIEKGRDLYFSDKKYLDNLLYTNDTVVDEHEEIKTELHSLEKIETDIKKLNTQLQTILKNKQRAEKIKSDLVQRSIPPQTKPKLVDENIVTRKNEEITLVLAIVLGLVSLQGIGHIYIRKIARGIGILVLSLLLSTLCISYLVVHISIPSFMSSFFLPLLVVGYLGLYIFQVLDSRKLC